MGSEVSRLAVATCSSLALVSGLIYVVKWHTTKSIFSKLRFAGDDTTNKEGKQIVQDDIKGRLPPGLHNHGNLCFVNATLQAISALDAFKTAITNKDGLQTENNSPLIPCLHGMLLALSVPALCEGTALTNSPLLDALSNHGWVISHRQQQDAHEFLHILLSTVEEELTSKKAPIELLEKFALVEEHDRPMKKRTIVSRTGCPSVYEPKWTSPFQGTLANLLLCVHCGHQFPVKFEVFESVPLACRSTKQPHSMFSRSSLECRLGEFTAKETVHSVACPQCVQRQGPRFRTTCVKRTLFARLPKCLCVHFPRTQVDNQGNPFKDSTHIRFPESLNVEKYCFIASAMQQRRNGAGGSKQTSDREGNSDGSLRFDSTKPLAAMYQLQAVVVHCGQVNDGHFITYRRFCTAGESRNRWLHISDTSVTMSTLEQCMDSTAYMLFYDKQ